MNKVTITINTVNSAFKDEHNEESECHEVARILREVADKLDDCYYPEKLKDINGNNVGTVEYE